MRFEKQRCLFGEVGRIHCCKQVSKFVLAQTQTEERQFEEIRAWRAVIFLLR